MAVEVELEEVPREHWEHCCFPDGLQGALVSPSSLWLGTLAGFEAIHHTQLLPLLAITSAVVNTRAVILPRA